MSEKYIIECDECGETTEKPEEYKVPKGWYWLERLYLDFGGSRIKTGKRKGYLKSKHRAEFDENKDPHFCSRDCLDNWLRKQIDKIS